jgi:hypothetical protein
VEILDPIKDRAEQFAASGSRPAPSAPVLPLGAGEGADVGARHPVLELEVVGADFALAPLSPDQGIEMPEDGGAGAHPHEHLHKMGEDRHEEDGVGGEIMKLEAELLQEQEEEGGDRRNQPAHGVRVEENELPCGKVAEGDFAGPDLLRVFRRGPSHKAAHQVLLGLGLEAARKRKRRHGDGAEIAKDGSQGSREEKDAERKEADCKECAEMKGRYSIC